MFLGWTIEIYLWVKISYIETKDLFCLSSRVCFCTVWLWKSLLNECPAKIEFCWHPVGSILFNLGICNSWMCFYIPFLCHWLSKLVRTKLSFSHPKYWISACSWELLAWNIRSPAGSLVHQYACGNDFVNFTASINALGSHAIYGEKNISDDVPPMH